MTVVEHAPSKRKVKVGRVVSDKMDKTIVVSVERLSRHRLYKRVIRLTTKFTAHDPENTAHVGDTVRIVESRPLSRTKRWRLVDVVQRATDTTTSILSEEEATSEAIHSVAHPGRRDDAESGEAARNTSESPAGSPAKEQGLQGGHAPETAAIDESGARA